MFHVFASGSKNLKGSRRITLKKERKKRNKFCLVLANKSENPNFETWRLIVIIRPRKKQESVNVT